MSDKSTGQIQCHAWLRAGWIHKSLISRDEERIRFGQRRQALLVLDIPTGSLIVTLIFTLIVTMLFAAHADPFLTVERRTSRPTGRARVPRPLHRVIGGVWTETRQAASLLEPGVFK